MHDQITALNKKENIKDFEVHTIGGSSRMKFFINIMSKYYNKIYKNIDDSLIS